MFPTIDSRACCDLCSLTPRAAVRMESGAVAHLCMAHLVDLLCAGHVYLVVQVVAAAIPPSKAAAAATLRLVSGG